MRSLPEAGTLAVAAPASPASPPLQDVDIREGEFYGEDVTKPQLEVPIAAIETDGDHGDEVGGAAVDGSVAVQIEPASEASVEAIAVEAVRA